MSAIKGSLYTILFFVASEIFYVLYLRHVARKHRRRGIENESETRISSPSSVQVLFFPDKKIACQDFFLGTGCFKPNCIYSHEETSLSQLYKCMSSCKTSMDVCIYLITCKGLADIISDLYKKGVKIRIITDKDQLYSSGSKIWNLRKEGIPVRVNDNSYLMHHKFVIIDGDTLINGSFNWTYNAITGNEDNIIITSDATMIALFKAQFEKLWNKFDKQLTQTEEDQISTRQSKYS